MSKIILTPINLTSTISSLTENGKVAPKDYRREQEKFSSQPEWDDSKFNNAVVGMTLNILE
jgi:hypothetical protein